jgi:hypothetical protein
MVISKLIITALPPLYQPKRVGKCRIRRLGTFEDLDGCPAMSMPTNNFSMFV